MMSPRKSLNIYQSGNPNGIPVIFIHGGAGGVWNWMPTVRRLENISAYLPELPEHGSSRFLGPFSIHSTADEIIRMIREQIPGGKAHLVGLSVGGQVALDILARAPDIILNAVISGSLALPLPGYSLGIYSEAVMKMLYKLFIRPWRQNDRILRWMMKSMTGISETYFSEFKQNLQSITLSGWTHTMSEYYRYRLPHGIQSVQNPVLLVAGEHETVEVLPTHRLLHRVLPNNHSVILGSSQNWSAAREHNWSTTLPDLCARTVNAWIHQSTLPAELTPMAG